MKFEKRFNPIDGFDFTVLNDSDFKEDAVREELISPLIKALGYSATKPFRIIRSKPLKHPFVSVGSARKKITCIPDYLLEVHGQCAWILEAKSPSENILVGAHVEQAYSYAIHSEIRVPLFALCNGKEFALFHISKEEPLMHFDMKVLALYYENLAKFVSPQTVLEYDFRLAKDFGLHLKRLGFKDFKSIILPGVPINYIAQLDDGLFTTATGIETEEGDRYVISLDFEEAVLHQMKGKVPDSALKILLNREKGHRKVAQFAQGVFLINIDCRVGDALQENSDEIFLPFIINRIV